jgi:hypothetical protein
VFRLTVTDNGGLSASDDVQVTVNAAPAPASNLPPIVILADSFEVRFPVITIELDAGFSYDPEGERLDFAWQFVKGPGVPRIMNQQAAKTVITNLTEGVYTFDLVASDQNGQRTTKRVTVKVIKGSQRQGVTVAKVFPNPVKDNLFIDLESETKGKILLRLVDLSGKEIQRWEFSKISFAQRFIINVGGLPHGSYVLSIQDDGNLPIHRKLIH